MSATIAPPYRSFNRSPSTPSTYSPNDGSQSGMRPPNPYTTGSSGSRMSPFSRSRVPSSMRYSDTVPSAAVTIVVIGPYST
jgi:hypothetical protein